MIRDLFCDKRFIWNPSNCGCECDKSSDTGEYLDYKNCKCRKKLVDKLVEECSKVNDGNEKIYNGTLIDCGDACNSCTVYTVLLVSVFLIIIGIISAFICFHWYFERSDTSITNINPNSETVICETYKLEVLKK